MAGSLGQLDAASPKQAVRLVLSLKTTPPYVPHWLLITAATKRVCSRLLTRRQTNRHLRVLSRWHWQQQQLYPLAFDPTVKKLTN